jgi:hypothetical protein
MKFSSSFSALLVVLPLMANVSGLAVPEAALVSRQRGGGRFGQGQGQVCQPTRPPRSSLILSRARPPKEEHKQHRQQQQQKRLKQRRRLLHRRQQQQEKTPLRPVVVKRLQAPPQLRAPRILLPLVPVLRITPGVVLLLGPARQVSFFS